MELKLLIIFISILSCLAMLAMFLFYKKSAHVIRNKKFQQLKLELNLARDTYFNAMMNRIDLVTKYNPKFKQLNKQVSGIYNDIFNTMALAKKHLEALQVALLKPKIKSKKLKALYLLINQDKVNLNHLHRQFDQASALIVQQDDFVRNEFNFYQGQLRQVIKLYNLKIMQLQHLHQPIKLLIAKLQKCEGDFNQAISISQLTKAHQITKLYSTNILKLIKVVDQGIALEAYLYQTLPQMLLKFKTKFETLNQKGQLPLAHLESAKQSQIIGKHLQKAKVHFLKLEITKTKALVLKALKALKASEFALQLELQAYALITKTLPALEVEVKRILAQGQTLKEQYLALKSTPAFNAFELEPKFNQLAHNLQELTKATHDLQKLDVAQSDLPYSVQKARLELLVGQMQWTIKIINECMLKLWALQADQVTQTNQFKRAEAALHELIVRINQVKLNLLPAEKLHLRQLNAKQAQIVPMLKQANSADPALIQDFTDNIAHFYQLINIKLEMALYVQNMLKALANKRATNPQFNFALQGAEEQYLEGHYAQALNGIINMLERK